MTDTRRVEQLEALTMEAIGHLNALGSILERIQAIVALRDVMDIAVARDKVDAVLATLDGIDAT